MKYSHKIEGTVAIVSLEGKIMGDPAYPAFYDYIKKLLDDGCTAFLFDFKKASSINSLGVGLIVTVSKSILEAGRKMVICGANARISGVFFVVKLQMYLQNYDDCAEALAALSD